MLCQKCKINNANVKIIRSINGNVVEYYLCSSCAEAEEMGGANKYMKDFGENIFGFFSPRERREYSCRGCGLSFREFKNNGKFGCEKCFDAFSEILPSAVKDIHGALSHTGKIPKRSGMDIIKRKKIKDMRQQLEKAVKEENFELAATLRDEIREMEGQI